MQNVQINVNDLLGIDAKAPNMYEGIQSLNETFKYFLSKESIKTIYTIVQ